MRKGFIRIAVWILFVPVFGLLVSGGIGVWLATADQPDGLVCQGSEIDWALAFAGPWTADKQSVWCSQHAGVAFLWKASASVLALTLLVPLSFGGVTFGLSRSRQWLARIFPWIVRPTMVCLAAVLVQHGVLIAYIALQLTAITNYPGLFLAGAGFAIGFAIAALLIVWEALRRRQPEPIRVTGLLVGSDRLPELTAHIQRVAKQLNVDPPARVIVGLEVSAFVTRVPVSLRGAGVLEPAETLYLPTCALRALEQDQLEAVIAHELAHFRGEDVAFTERFIPSFLALQSTISTLTPYSEPPGSTLSISGYRMLPRIPGLLLTQLMTLVTGIAVARIRRARELEADRVAAQLASPEAVARSLVKLSLLMAIWRPFRAANVRYLGSGRARPNLSADFIGSAGELLGKPNADRLHRMLLFSRLSHPTDTHPPLAERIRALGLDPDVALNESLPELGRAPGISPGLLELENELTAIENEWMSRPGTPVVMDTETALPETLKLR